MSTNPSTVTNAPIERWLPPEPQRPLRVAVSVDNNHCHRFAVCQQEAPHVFQLSADGRLAYDPFPDVRLGRSIVGWRTGPRAVTARLDDGNEVAADAVLIAIGTAPRVDWLADLPLDLRDGVLCSATCHVIGLDNVVAAGDVARWPNARFGGDARRVEHWINAVEHGRAAAESLLAGPTTAKPFAPLPRFWSEQHGVRIQAVGVPALADRVALAEGSLESRRLVAACLDGQRLVGALGVDSPRAMLRYAAMVDQMTTFVAAPLRPPLAPPPPALLPPDPEPVDRRPLAPVFAMARSTGPIPIQRF